MDKLSEYIKFGYVGNDAALEISLFEYGLIWINTDTNNDNDTKFIFGVRHDGSEYNMFDHAWINPDVDIYQEYDWIEYENWIEIYRMVGMNREQWDDLSLTSKIADLIMFWGSEEIFGTSYYPYKIENDTE